MPPRPVAAQRTATPVRPRTEQTLLDALATEGQAGRVKASPSALRLIAAYAALTALLALVVLLPGNPSFTYPATAGLLQAIVLQGLLVWRLASGRRSPRCSAWSLQSCPSLR
jgi:hypothetical protein